MSDEDAAELVALRREFGISAEEAYTRLPAWEVDLLLASLEEEDGGGEMPTRAAAASVDGDPFDDVPEHLAGL